LRSFNLIYQNELQILKLKKGRKNMVHYRKFYLCTTFLLGLFFLLRTAWAIEQNPGLFKEDSMFTVSCYFGKQIEPLLPLMQEWGEREYIHYPYLWVPPKDEIFPVYVLLAKENEAVLVVVKKQEQVVAIAAGMTFDSKALQSMFDYFQPSLEQSLVERTELAGIDPSKLFYMSCFLTAPEVRNDEKLVALVYDHCAAFAHQIGKNQLCYFEGLGSEDNPLKPENPIAIEPWGTAIQGVQSMNIQFDLTWETLQKDGSVKDEVHTIEFFRKEL
jgi:hypothetical protein